jgi:hypothetical protein
LLDRARDARARRGLFLARLPARFAPLRVAFRADFLVPFLAFFAPRLALFLTARLALFLAARFALFLAAFFAGRRGDLLTAGRRSSSVEKVGAEEGVAGVEAGVGAGAGGGSEGSGSIQPEPDQPISI